MKADYSHKEKKKQRMKSEILDSVISLVEEEGLRDITLLKISKRLGLTKQALYHYYSSKEELLFETIVRELTDTANIIENETGKAKNGSDAVEIFIRTFFGRYFDRLNVFSLVYNTYLLLDLSGLANSQKLKEIHSLNEKFFSNCERLLKIEQKNGKFPKNKKPRVFSFNAQTAVIGILNMLALAKTLDDPLIHNAEDLINDVCQTYKYISKGA